MRLLESNKVIYTTILTSLMAQNFSILQRRFNTMLIQLRERERVRNLFNVGKEVSAAEQNDFKFEEEERPAAVIVLRSLTQHNLVTRNPASTVATLLNRFRCYCR